MKELWTSVRIGRTVTFSHAFLAIQYVTVNKFIVFFTGFRWMMNLPLYIRIIQNLKILTPKSIRAIVRFLLIILISYFPSSHPLWLSMKSFVTCWVIYNDFVYSYKMQRLFKGEFCYYPTYIYLVMFSINVGCRIEWVFKPTYAILLTVMRKNIENYFRLESQSAARKEEDFVRAILDKYGIDDICV